MRKVPRNYMSTDFASAFLDFDSAVAGNAAFAPQPAFVWGAYGDIRPKAFFQRGTVAAYKRTAPRTAALCGCTVPLNGKQLVTRRIGTTDSDEHMGTALSGQNERFVGSSVNKAQKTCGVRETRLPLQCSRVPANSGVKV